MQLCPSAEMRAPFRLNLFVFLITFKHVHQKWIYILFIYELHHKTTNKIKRKKKKRKEKKRKKKKMTKMAGKPQQRSQLQLTQNIKENKTRSDRGGKSYQSLSSK